MNDEKLAIPSISEALSTFSRVDAATNPASLVDFLDQAAAAYFAEMNLRSFELLRLRENASALDVGCGTGDDVRAMRGMVGPHGHVTGVDLSRRMVDEAFTRDLASPLRSRFLIADAEDLPFALRLTLMPPSPDFERNYNSGKAVEHETALDARVAHVRLYHDARHFSMLEVPMTATAPN